jgi:hypothetical protein
VAIKEIHQYDIGTAFDIEIRDETDEVVNLSGATTLKFFFQKPNEATVVEKGPNFINPPGTDGLLRYITQEDDLNQAGMWRYQAYVVTPSGKWYSDVQTFKVFPNIKKV